MTISSINTNLAALLAQTNIGVATQNSSNDVAALSSGNRIVNASTDVAALAAGTALQSQVNTLNTALTVASQGSSLLQVADGSLAQIQTILQRQQAITTSAQSGSLSSTQLGFLDQEFQSLSSEINQLAGSTNFNGVNLIDGSIQGGTAINTNTVTGSSALPGTATIATITGAVTAGDGVTITVGNQPSETFTFGTSAGDINISSASGATGENENAANLAAALNNSNNPQLANVHFTATNTGAVEAYYTGDSTALADIPAITVSAAGTNAHITTSNATFSGSPVATFTSSASGDLRVGDTFTIGSHSVQFVAEGTTPTGNQVALGGTLNATLANLATFLNNADYTDLSGVTFSGSATTPTLPTLATGTLKATYSGSGSAPTVTTTFTNGTAPTYSAANGDNGTIDAATTISTFSNTNPNSFEAGDTYSVTSNGHTYTLTAVASGAVAGSGTTFNIGTSQTNTLANIAAGFSSAQLTNLGLSSITSVGATTINAVASQTAGAQTVTASYTPNVPAAGASSTVAKATTFSTFTANTNFNVGDTYTISSTTNSVSFTLTGVSGSGTAGSTFQVTAGNEATTLSALAGALTAGQLAALGLSSVTVNGDSLQGVSSTGANNTVTGSYTPNPADIPTNTGGAQTVGTSSTLIDTLSGGNFEAGDTYKLSTSSGSVTLTAVASGATGNQFNIGTTLTNSVTAIVAALQGADLTTLGLATLTSSGTAISGTVSAGTLATTGSITTSRPSLSTASGTVAAPTTIATFTNGSSNNFQVGDTFSIIANGTSKTVTAVASGAVQGTSFVIGNSEANTLAAIVAAFSPAQIAALGYASLGVNSAGTAITAVALPAATQATTTAYTPASPTLTNNTSQSVALASTIGTFTNLGTDSFQIGDTYTISTTAGSVTLTAVAPTATPTTDQFNVDTTSSQTQAQQNAQTLQNLIAAVTPTNLTTLGLASIGVNTTNDTIYGVASGASNLTGTTSTYTATTSAVTGVTGASLNASGIIGLGAGATSAIGVPTGSLFVSSAGTSGGATATDYGSGVNLSNVSNNADFVGAFDGTGTIGAITANYVSTGLASTSGVTFSTVVGNDTYTTGLITNQQLTSTSAPVTLNFTGANTVSGTAEGGSFTLTLQPQASDITSQGQASQLATGIIAGLSSVTAYQNRNVLSFNNNYSATVSGTQTGTLAGSSLAYNSGSFANLLISNVSVSAPSTGSTDAKITATINGQTYSTIAGIGDTFKTNSEIVLENTANPAQQLTLTTGSTAATGTGAGIAIDLSSASNAEAFQTALSNALGLNNANAGLSFQVGSSTADTIGVTLGSATTSSLFGGQTVNVLTQSNASTAATTVQNALNTVTSLRATVGADEERFNYATSAIQSASQNETAAQSNLLDTDVASTSTSFATAQVQLQAGIAVLAQANQLQQNLLKLIA